jgi:hypothetical protein
MKMWGLAEPLKSTLLKIGPREKGWIQWWANQTIHVFMFLMFFSDL